MAKVHEAMCNVLADVDAISKDRVNKEQGFRYRGLEDVMNELHPLFAKHRLLMVPKLFSVEYGERIGANGKSSSHTRAQVVYEFIADDGSMHVVGPVLGESIDSYDKSCSKAMSMAHKTAMMQTFCIPTVDTEGDADNRSPEFGNRAPARPPPDPMRPALKSVREAGDPLPGAAHHPDTAAKNAASKPAAPAAAKPEAGTVSATLKLIAGGDQARAQVIVSRVFPGKTSTQQLSAPELEVLRVFLRCWKLCGNDLEATMRYFLETCQFGHFPALSKEEVAQVDQACAGQEKPAAKSAPTAGAAADPF